jgi:two-component system heavy metal sensor histidine kinase CusS
MNLSFARLRRAWSALKGSMAAQIAVAIATISIVLIGGSGFMIDHFLARELGEENELLLLANLAFIRDDLAAKDFDLTRAAGPLVDRTEGRVHRLHAAMFDPAGKLIASSPHFPVPASALPKVALSTTELPAEVTVMQMEGLRERLGALTTVWIAPDRRHFRLLLGSIPLPASAIARGLPASVSVALAIEPTETLELHARDRSNVLIAMALAALLSILLGVAFARRIVGSAKRLSTAAGRISAQALHERLPLEGTPTELIESTLAFNRMLDRLQGAFDRLSAFSSDLAHDLRTPIGNLMGEAQVALSRPRSADEYRAVLESAVEEYERLSRMISNMLFLARADNYEARPAATWVNTRVALERVMAYFEQVAEDRGVAMHVAISGAAPRRVWADETLLIRAVGNLVSNALRYASRGSAIELKAESDIGAAAVVEISNEGPPIAPEHQARIFERFFRIDSSREGSASGSGLGLAIVRSIMELHGGRAVVVSAPGQRTRFRLWFPGPAG